jgi:UDP-N-acetylglucosamine 2-epimerase
VRVVTVVGARPQFVKAAPVSAALRAAGIDEALVHTGQHYDQAMSGSFFAELALPKPAHNLGVGSGSHAIQTAAMLTGINDVLVAQPPDWVLVYGDTNSTLAGALAAAKLHIPVAHVEAGLRSFDRRMPEEVNRVVTDHVATLCLAPSAVAVDNLAREGIVEGVIDVGDVMVDSVLRVTASLPDLPPLAGSYGLLPGTYAVATLHRAATTDDPERLARAIDVLAAVELPVLFSVHPRTAAALQRTGLQRRLDMARNVIAVPPLGYGELIGLVARARVVLTDSGGLQKEAYFVGTQCLTLRAETEWVETLESGWNTLVDLDTARARAALDRGVPDSRPALYGDGHAAERIAAALHAFAGA